jgi:hypothetical protein
MNGEYNVKLIRILWLRTSTRLETLQQWLIACRRNVWVCDGHVIMHTTGSLINKPLLISFTARLTDLQFSSDRIRLFPHLPTLAEQRSNITLPYFQGHSRHKSERKSQWLLRYYLHNVRRGLSTRKSDFAIFSFSDNIHNIGIMVESVQCLKNVYFT